MNEQALEPGRDLIVVGASAGGVEALSELVRGLPEDLPAAVLVVLHVSPEAPSALPRILARQGRLPATHAEDGEQIRPGRIYVAPPNHHLLVEPGRLRVSLGPKENRHRPAVDPLFRTAARAYGPRVVGVILTGYGDDGAAGLQEVARHGGVTVVQSPGEAQCQSMPLTALKFTQADYCLPVRNIPPTLEALARDPITTQPPPQAGSNPGHHPESRPGSWPTRSDRPIPEPAMSFKSEEEVAFPEHPVTPGPLGGFTCPHCHGHLWELDDGGLLRFRCRVGHAFTADSLLAEKCDTVEAALWAALNTLEESAALAERLAGRARSNSHELAARRLEERSRETQRHAEVLRTILGSGSGSLPHSITGAANDHTGDSEAQPVRSNTG